MSGSLALTMDPSMLYKKEKGAMVLLFGVEQFGGIITPFCIDTHTHSQTWGRGGLRIYHHLRCLTWAHARHSSPPSPPCCLTAPHVTPSPPRFLLHTNPPALPHSLACLPACLASHPPPPPLPPSLPLYHHYHHRLFSVVCHSFPLR